MLLHIFSLPFFTACNRSRDCLLQILQDKEEEVSAAAASHARVRSNLARKRQYSERLRAARLGGLPRYRGRRSFVKAGGREETASDVGYRRSPRASEDGAISLPAIPNAGGRGRDDKYVSPRVGRGRGGKMTEEQIRENRFREAKIKANERQKAVRRRREEEREERNRQRERQREVQRRREQEERNSEWDNGMIPLTEEAVMVYEREEKRAREMRERTDNIARRRRTLEARSGIRKEVASGGEDGWLEDVAKEDRQETKALSDMYMKSELADRFRALRARVK